MDCVYWHGKALSASDVEAGFFANGHCRRSPPTSDGWPQVTSNEWCGEWRDEAIDRDPQRELVEALVELVEVTGKATRL